MQMKPTLMTAVVLLLLAAATTAAYTLSRLTLTPSLPAALGLPPLTRLDLPPQTQNGITASLESFYADASRLVFQVRLTGEGVVSSVNLNDENGAFVNASTSFGPAGKADLSISQMEFDTVTPLPGDRFKGQLEFSITANPGDAENLADFHFNLDIPIHPALTLRPKQTIWANGIQILFDRAVITPAFTQAYLCYIPPTNADWTISYDNVLRVDRQASRLQTYSLLFDSTLGDGSKGGEPGWTSPVTQGRCVKAGFAVGAENPGSITLTIPGLEQSTPEVIPPEEITAALEKLKIQGIEMTYESFSHGNSWEFENLPAGMTQQQAYREFINALGYIHPGPWIFDIVPERTQSAQPVFSTSSYGAPTPIPVSTNEPPILGTLDARIRSFDLSPDLKTLAFATSNGIVLYNFDNKHNRVLKEAENFFSVAWSPDGKKLAAGSILMRGEESGLPRLLVWDSAVWEILFESQGAQEASLPFGTVAWSPDGKLLAASLHDRGLAVIEIESGKITSQLADFLLPSSNISWSPDGSRLLATGDLGFGFRRWRVDTTESVRLYDPRAGTAALQLDWSSDGERIASGHAGGMVCFWTVETNQCDGFIQAHQNSTFSLAWSPDGTWLATGGGVIRIWDTQTGRLITAFGQNDGSIYTQLELLNSKTLVSLETGYASEGLSIVHFWDAETGSVLFEFHGASGMFGE